MEQKEVKGAFMYYLTETCKRIEDKKTVLFGVADESRDYGDFTEDLAQAEHFIDLLNSQKVESVHVADIIEDLFY